MKSKQNSIEESSKEVIARHVVTPTAKYFVPEYGEVEAKAEDLTDVAKRLKKLKKQEVNDGN
jgi:hypothetical protein